MSRSLAALFLLMGCAVEADDVARNLPREIPGVGVLVDIHEGIPAKDVWPEKWPSASCSYTQPSLALVGIPKKYTSTGVIDERSNPLLIRAHARWVTGPKQASELEFVLRSKNAARLYVDGALIAENKFLNRNSSGHEEVPQLEESTRADLRPPAVGCQESRARRMLDAGEHLVVLEAFIGGKGLRLEVDELFVAVARAGEQFELVGGGDRQLAITEEGWQAHVRELEQWLAELDAANRLDAAKDWHAYWQSRHEYARQVADAEFPGKLPVMPLNEGPGIHVGNDPGNSAGNEIDRFITTKLRAEGVTPGALIEDLAFLRRATLDLVGVVPTADEIARFQADAASGRRAAAIDRLLADRRYADQWMGYWQDVLAENPGILKPELNNTGPFRWWIHESLLDNKPVDQFATELALMEGSIYYGGPAGFGVATQNDVPMAAKAHILAKAFLAMDMTCARCHDAPSHPFKQQELFHVAAMLGRKPIKLPATSSVPRAPGARQPLVTISLTPGQEISPDWPFAHLVSQQMPDAMIWDPADTRSRMAMQLTSPHNRRFAKVVVNRVWRRLLGRGLIEPVDDWDAGSSHTAYPELLDYLARELLRSGYDLKQTQRLIMRSQAYQRAIGSGRDEPAASLFASPSRRRMSAEQLVDSLFTIAGKPFRSERLTLDPEGRRSVDTFLNLGDPRRAWQFTSLSNERDRPALALPVAQSVVDLLVAFGWRDARPNPVTYRDEEVTALQPLTLANGVAGNRAVRLSDDSRLTDLSLRDQPLEQLVDQLFLQILTRLPLDDERSLVVSTLADGYELRRTPESAKVGKVKSQRTAVSWSNHLSAEATRIKQELEREVQAGDPPTTRLQSQWRERMEDVVWALLNSPEFVFIP